jgi:hypothetical protein
VFGDSTNSDGVRGHSANGYGVHGISDETSPEVAGVFGIGTRAAAGVMGWSSAGPGVHGQSDGGPAVYAEGDLEVTDDLEVSGAYKGNIRSSSSTDGAPFPRPAFDSGWRALGPASSLTFDHEIGGDPDDYLVDLSVRGDALGRHNRGVGGDVGRTTSLNYGAYWRQLTDESVDVIRLNEDNLVQQVRVRIWVVR